MKQKINTSASRGFRMKRLISFSFALYLTRVIFNAVSLSLWMNVKFLCYETVNPMSQLILLFMQTTNEKRLRFKNQAIKITIYLTELYFYISYA